MTLEALVNDLRDALTILDEGIANTKATLAAKNQQILALNQACSDYEVAVRTLKERITELENQEDTTDA